MKRIPVFILFIIFKLIGYSQNQDVKFGVTMATQAVQTTKFMHSYYQPENINFTYQEINEGQGIINRSHIFNAYSLGLLIKYTFRKSTIGFEPQYFMQRSVFSFEKESYSERVVGMKAFRLPIFYSYKLFKNNNSMFLTVGAVFSVAKNFDFQHPGTEYLLANGTIYNGGVDYGDNHFNSILYSNHNYWQSYIGIGKNFGRFNLTFRFMARTRKSKERIAAQIGQLEMSISYDVLGFSELKKKRKVYHE